MSTHERNWAKLHHDVAFGRAGGRIIWQPRIIAWYHDRLFEGRPLPDPYEGMSLSELYRALDCSNRIYEYGECYQSHEHPDVHITRRDIDATDYEVVWETPVGNQRAVYRRSDSTSWHRPIKWPIADEHELEIATWRETHRTWTWDEDRFESLQAEWGDLGAPTMFMCRTTIQKLLIEDMGVRGTVLAMRRYPAACERYFEALDVTQNRWVDVINDSPVDIINFGDNIHAATLPPRWFEQYVLPVYQRRAARLHAAGKFVYSHWDGDCKPLLRFARQTDLDGIEAITPLPQGDVTLEETRDALGDMFLIDGIPAVYFEKTYSEQTLIDCAKRCIELFAPNLILGISDEMSSTGEIERIRLVGDIVDEYNASL